MKWLPWSARQSPEHAREYIKPKSGVPDGVLSVMLDLVLAHFYVRNYARDFELDRERASRYLRVFHESLPRDINEAVRYFSNNRSQLINAFDLILGQTPIEGFGNAQLVQKLNHQFEEARSEFAIRPNQLGNYELQKRIDAVTTSILDDLLSAENRASHLMSQAWSNLYSRSPNPTAAVLDAVKALEVIAAPIVTPDDDAPSLGKISSSLRVKPDKWQTSIGDTRLVERIANDLDFIWTSHRQTRHGHPEKEMEISRNLAEVLLHVALCDFELLRHDVIKLRVDGEKF